MTEMKEWDCLNDVVYAKSSQDSDEAYTKWATRYDEDMSNLTFFGNDLLAKYSFDFITNDESSLMLDVAAGTGNTALSFKKAGYKGQADAIEINAAMLEVAKKKNLYRNAICHEVTETDPLPVPNDTYDFATVGGALIMNHLPQGCIPHVINALKIGGLLIFRSRVTPENDEYQNVLSSILNGLVEEKKIAVVKSEAVTVYKRDCRETGKPMQAQLSVYKRLK